MTIDSFDAVFYTAILILPGFIVNSVIDTTNPPKRLNDGLYFLKCFALSIVNCAIWCWLYKLIIECDKLSTFWHWILLVAVSIFGALIFGVLIAAIKQKQIIDFCLSKLKINTIHSTPTAWDYYFSKQVSGFVIVTLVDDVKLYGWYSCNSFSSSDSDERDIYIEKAYKENWVPDEESNGFYVPKGQIKYIEFKKGGK